MEDILITDIQEFEEITDSEVIEKEVPDEGKEIKEDEREQINKSDSLVLGGDVNNNNPSGETLGIEGEDIPLGEASGTEAHGTPNYGDKLGDFEFYKTVIWTNGNPSNPVNNVTVNLSQPMTNFDYLEFTFQNGTNNSTRLGSVICSVSDFAGSGYTYQSPLVFRGATYYVSRNLKREDDNRVSLGTTTAGNNISAGAKAIPLEIIGYKKLELENVIPDNPSVPSVSGNTINNYYITVSGNGVSYNLIDKPLSEYTPTESMFALSILFALGIGFVILMRKVVFRWK